MSDVERYWDALRAKWPTPQPAFKDMDRARQEAVLQSINILLAVLHSNP